MSRKTLLAVLAILIAILAFFKGQFGLALDPVAVIGGLGAVVLYLLFEGKLDFKRMGAQAGKWKDPKFWTAFIAALLPVLNEQLGLNLPAETIVAVLAAVLTFLFGLVFRSKTA